MTEAANTEATPSERVSHAGYRVVIEPNAERVRAVVNGVTLADSEQVLVMRETRLPWIFYFPREDVRMDMLIRSDHRTHCPFKGDASYWTLEVGDKIAQNAAWSYEDPYDESSAVRDYIAFDWNAVDAWYVDEEKVVTQPLDTSSSKANPFVNWLVQEAWQADSTQDLVRRLAEALVAGGLPIWRLRLLVRTLNPQLAARGYTWQRDVDGIAEFLASHDAVQSSAFQDSPFAAILNGEGGIRRRLEGPEPLLDFPVLNDLLEQGATDYAALPLRFSDGQVNIVTIVSDRPGGFSTDDLGRLYEVLPNLSRHLEAHAHRVSSMSLLQTYLGRNAGERVMNGLVRRGDGEDVHAVIWLSDLRDSTALAESLSRADYLAALNQYFDSVAGAVIEQGGEVLKFIGDAVLAIFPIDDLDASKSQAASQALNAVCDAQLRIAEVNDERTARGEPNLVFGTALHRGNLTYGNIGTTGRLDFTVIGPAVNEAARIEALSKTLGHPVLISSAFAENHGDALVSLGRHALRGVAAEQELFTLAPEPVEAVKPVAIEEQVATVPDA